MKDFDQYSELIAKFLAGESSLDEKEVLFSWTKADPANHEFFAELEQVWNMTQGADSSPFDTDVDEAWLKIDRSTLDLQQPSPQSPPPDLDFQTSGKVVPLSKRIMRWSIAAAILLSAGFGLWWFMQQPIEPVLVEVQTLDSEKKEITLPDNSKVWLNENSRLSYFENFNERNVELEGEAFFDVERMETSPFKIQSGEAVTTVLGTSFNVRAYPKEERIEVTVETGKVELAVTKEAIKPVQLPAGTSGVVYKKEEKVERIKEKLNNAVAWKTLSLNFDEDLMKDVITTLERYFDTDIEVSNEMIYECKFTSPFDKPTIEDVFAIVEASTDIKWEKIDGGYLLKGKGCQPDN